jgi:hypothetical protein
MIIKILGITHRPNFIKNDDSETGFCLRFQVEPTQIGTAEVDNPVSESHCF